MTDPWKVEYDERQFALMTEHLCRFEEGTIDLGTVIAGLESLLECLEAPEQSWKDHFLSHWAVLEEIYAVALDRKEQGLAPDVESTLNEPNNHTLINKSIQNLRRLLADRGTA